MVISTDQIAQMSREEKLQAMEAIWMDLSPKKTSSFSFPRQAHSGVLRAQDDAAVESPAWHEEVLKETEARVAAGQERIAGWEEAKQELRKRFE